MSTELKDWLNSINQTKKNLIDDNPSSEKEYLPYIINRCLSGHIDCIMFVNEMNRYHSLPKKIQYDFYLNSLRKKKRFSPWIKKEEIENLNSIKSYYKYSDDKAKDTLKLLSKKQIEFIKSKLDTGGKK